MLFPIICKFLDIIWIEHYCFYLLSCKQYDFFGFITIFKEKIDLFRCNTIEQGNNYRFLYSKDARKLLFLI